MDRKFSWALITGASSGIGEALAHLLAEKKIPLILHGRNRERLDRLADALRPKVEIQILEADLAHKEGRKLVLDKIYQYAPELVINNAGFGLHGDAITWETERLLEIVEVNSKAVLEFSLEGARTLLSTKKHGVILNVSSSAGEVPAFAGMAVYSASKAFVNRFSEALDVEMQPHGIRVLAACPGMVQTRFRERASNYEQQAAYEGHVPKPMTSSFAAEQIWWQIEREKPLHVFDKRTKFLIWLAKALPKKLVAKVCRKMILKDAAPGHEIHFT
jgi:uncharacterized protein